MMQWKKGEMTFETKEAEVVVEERVGPSSIFNYVVATLAASFSRVGVTSLAMVFAVLGAVLVAAVLFGATASDAAALGQWCRGC